MNTLMILLTTAAAGVIQGITGFGCGIVMMMVFPMMFALPQSAGCSTAIAVFLSLSMVITYRKHIRFEKIIPPAVLYIAVCSASIYCSTMFDQNVMKKVFGVFLLLLSVYYLFVQKNTDRKKLSLPVSVLCIVVSAVCDGLFGIGGPLMVLYFLAQTHNTHEYLGTIQTFFLINSVYNTVFRVINGILTVSHIAVIFTGVIGIVIGGMIGNRIVDKLDGIMVRKLTYIMIGISGLINLF